MGQTASAVVENLREHVTRARCILQNGAAGLHAPVSSLDIVKYVGIVLADGLSGAEEALMEKIGDRTDIFFVGGSARGRPEISKTQVMLDGKAYTNAAVLLILELKKGFDIIKTQSFRRTGKTLVATKVDEPCVSWRSSTISLPWRLTRKP